MVRDVVEVVAPRASTFRVVFGSGSVRFGFGLGWPRFGVASVRIGVGSVRRGLCSASVRLGSAIESIQGFQEQAHLGKLHKLSRPILDQSGKYNP